MAIYNLLNQIDTTEVVGTQDNLIKASLTIVIMSGERKECLGKNYNVDEIENVDEKEIKKLYARYEANLGRHTTKLFKKTYGFGLH